MPMKSAEDNLVPITFRASTAERMAFEARAQEENKSLSEWLRERTVAHIAFGANYRLLIAEFCAMRRVVLELHRHILLHRQLPADETIREIVDKADADKFTMADPRIAKYLGD